MRAYVTLLSDAAYLPGALALHRSLRRVGAHLPFRIALGAQVDEISRQILRANGIETIDLGASATLDADIAALNASHDFARWNHTFDKLKIFDLTAFEKIVYLDADMSVLANIDFLFEAPDLAAASEVDCVDAAQGKALGGFNSGLLVIAPATDRSQAILAQMPRLRALGRIVGDQDALNMYFDDWPRRPELHLDAGLNMRFKALEEHGRRHGYQLADGAKAIRVVHFVGRVKPWEWSFRKRWRALGKALIWRRWREAWVLWRYFGDLAAARAIIRDQP